MTRGHAFTFVSIRWCVCFFVKIFFPLMACFALFCFHLQNLLLFFSHSHSSSLFSSSSSCLLSWSCCRYKEEKRRVFVPLLCGANFRASWSPKKLNTHSQTQSPHTYTYTYKKSAKFTLFAAFFPRRTILLKKTNKEENAIKNRTSGQQQQNIAQHAANTQSA